MEFSCTKKSFYFSLSVLLVFICCSKKKSSDDETTGSPAESFQIFIVGKNMTPEWNSLKKGIQSAAEGYPGVSLTWIQPVKPGDIKGQKNIIKKLDSSISGLILDPVDDVALSIPVKKLADKGILVFTINTPLEENIANSHSGTPVASLGALPALRMGELLSNNGSILMLKHPASQDVSSTIATQFKQVLGDSFPEIVILSEKSYENPTVESAYSLSETLLIMYPQIKGVFCTHQIGTQGMLKALRDIDKSTVVKLLGSGFSETFELALGEGEIEALYIEDFYQSGIHILENLMKAILKTDYPKQSLSKIQIITRDNIHSDSLQSLIQSLTEDYELID